MLLFAPRRAAVVAASTLFSAVVLSAIGCSSVPTFPVPPHDAGAHCSDAEPCASGQMCLQGHCYAACDMTHPCSARETCTGGVCVARTTDGGAPAHDVGNDAGPCDMLNCMDPTPVCNVALAMCLQCDATNHDSCGVTTGPVCDVGRGSCTSAAPTVCGPCNVTADCPTGLTCVHRVSPAADERVCLAGCASAACSDQGFSCVSAMCVPFASSCTAYRAAVTRLPCTMDSDCPQLGATIDTGLINGMCFDDGTTTGMTCHAACGMTTDCPVGQTCVHGTGVFGFCQ